MLKVKIDITEENHVSDGINAGGCLQENRIDADVNGQVLIFNSLFTSAELQVFHSQLLNAIGKRYISCNRTIPYNF